MVQLLVVPTLTMLLALGAGVFVLLKLRPRRGY